MSERIHEEKTMPFKDPAKRLEYHRRYNENWVPAHYGFWHKYNWKTRGLNPFEAERLYNSTSNCGICGVHLQRSQKHLDHDHATKRIRGVLCGNCNHAIGLMHEDKEIFAKAMNYLIGENKPDEGIT